MTPIILVDWDGLEREVRAIIADGGKNGGYFTTRKVSDAALAAPERYPHLTSDPKNAIGITTKGVRARISMLAGKRGWSKFSRGTFKVTEEFQ